MPTDPATVTQKTPLETLDLSWTEADLPQKLRTKHVHGMMPAVGKFIPQLAEVVLRRFFAPDQIVFDPFVGSGTTLVEANTLGIHSVGVDISLFSVILARAKTTDHDTHHLEDYLNHLLVESKMLPRAESSDWIRTWYHDQAAAELLAYRDATKKKDEAADVAKVILARAARSARRIPHHALDATNVPQFGPYWCKKHKRICQPTERAFPFLQRYTTDTIRRIKEFAQNRKWWVESWVVWGNAKTISDEDLQDFFGIIDRRGTKMSGILTSPPYVGLLDYHEQNRYAYELLELSDRSQEEIGPAFAGGSKKAQKVYSDEMVSVLSRSPEWLDKGAPVIIVVNDKHGLYPDILTRSGLETEYVINREVSRRTGQRGTKFQESVMICRVR